MRIKQKTVCDKYSRTCFSSLVLESYRVGAGIGSYVEKLLVNTISRFDFFRCLVDTEKQA